MAADQILVNSSGSTKIDTYTVATDKHRQAVVLGDPATQANVAAVTNSAPSSSAMGLVTRVVGYPTPAALAAGMANPTTPAFGSHLLVWNGSTWDPADSIGGKQKVVLYDSTGAEIAFAGSVGATISANADGTNNTANQDRVVARLEKYRAKSLDWIRGDLGIDEWVYQASHVATGSEDLADQTNPGYKGALFFWKVSGVTGGTSPTFTLSVHWKDPASGSYGTLASFGPESGTFEKIYFVGPEDMAASGGQRIYLPKVWRIQSTFTGSPTNVTWSLGVCYIP